MWWPVEGHRERGQHPARPGDAAEEGGSAPSGRGGGGELAMLVMLDRPPGQEAGSGSPVFGEERSAAVGPVVSEGLGEPRRLVLAAAVAPGFLQRDDVGLESLERFDQPGFPFFPRSEAAPDIPGEHAERRGDEITVRTLGGERTGHGQRSPKTTFTARRR